MPPLNIDTIASEIGMFIKEALDKHKRKLSVTGFKATSEDIMEFLHEDDFEDVIVDASDKAADFLKEHLCRFKGHAPGECELCQ